MRAVASAVFNKFAKPVAKKALQAGISQAGEKLGKKAVEKSGDLSMKKLGNMGKSSKANKVSGRRPAPRSGPEGSRAQQQSSGESSAEILNRLISGSGLKRNKRI